MNTEERVKQAIEEARGFLQSHGGDVEFVELNADNVVKVRLTGACGGCPMATQTLKQGVEAFVKREVPEIQAVEQV
jgi:Fe-S cluster biogenesis protein NfuA